MIQKDMFIILNLSKKSSSFLLPNRSHVLLFCLFLFFIFFPNLLFTLYLIYASPLDVIWVKFSCLLLTSLSNAADHIWSSNLSVAFVERFMLMDNKASCDRLIKLSL